MKTLTDTSTQSELKAAFLRELDEETVQLKNAYDTGLERVALKKQILGALPDDLPLMPLKIQAIAYQSDVELSYEFQTREHVKELFKRLPPVQTFLQEGGCTWFAPAQHLKQEPEVKTTLVGGAVYRVEHYLGKLLEKFTWYSLIGGKLVHVVCRAATPIAVVRRIKRTNVSDHEVEETWNYSALPNGKQMHWSGYYAGACQPVTVHWDSDEDFLEALDTRASDFTRTVLTSVCRC